MSLASKAFTVDKSFLLAANSKRLNVPSVDFKLGDKLNAQIQGYGKTKSLVKGPNKLQGSKVSGKLEVQRGRHALEGKGEYRPDTKDKAGQLTYKFKF